MVFESIKRAFTGGAEDSEYIEIDLGKEVKKAKVMVRPFVLRSFEDVNPVLNSLREGYTIAVIDIKNEPAKNWSDSCPNKYTDLKHPQNLANGSQAKGLAN